MNLTDRVKGYLVNTSNIVSMVGSVTSPHLKDLWFFCGKCSRLLPPEMLFLCQSKVEDELLIQNLGLFVDEKPNGAVKGIESGFKPKLKIVCLCSACVKEEGFSTESIPITYPKPTKGTVH